MGQDALVSTSRVRNVRRQGGLLSVHTCGRAYATGDVLMYDCLDSQLQLVG